MNTATPAPVGALGLPTLEVNDIRPVLTQLLTALAGTLPLKEGAAWLQLGAEVNLRIRRVADSVVVEFRDPSPVLCVHFGVSMERRVQGVTATLDKIVIEIDRFPDVTLKVLS